ncbi:MAG: iron-containing alcohol dehydrogenase, partial [Erysipelotrichaceae bacterium]|nr:iron-containing alcohol dehydrogenase [Erysipelotrichaceae bacterium]
MNDFVFISPTKMYFGKNSYLKIGEIIKSYDFKNVLLVYGKGSIKKNGIYQNVVESLNNNHISFIEISGVEANPKLSFIKNSLKSLKGKKID